MHSSFFTPVRASESFQSTPAKAQCPLPQTTLQELKSHILRGAGQCL